MEIVNLTQHNATQEQVNQGVVELPSYEKNILRMLLTFEYLPTQEDMNKRAIHILRLLNKDTEAVMIGGAPFFMSTLEYFLNKANIRTMYAFSQRVSHRRKK